MTRVINRREIEVVKLRIGHVHLIQPFSNLRDAKDFARRQLKHRAKFIGGKDPIVLEADLARSTAASLAFSVLFIHCQPQSNSAAQPVPSRPISSRPRKDGPLRVR